MEMQEHFFQMRHSEKDVLNTSLDRIIETGSIPPQAPYKIGGKTMATC